MKTKLLTLILISVLATTTMAEDKQTLLVKDPTGANPMQQAMLKQTLMMAALKSDTYQPIDEKSLLEAMAHGTDDGTIIDLILVSEITEADGEAMLSAKILEAGSASVLVTKMEIIELKEPSKLQKQFAEFAEKLFKQ